MNTTAASLTELKKLVSDRKDEISLILSSLMHRYEENYLLEKKIIDESCQLFPDNLYFTSRKQFHEKSYFEKYSARKTPRLSEFYIPASKADREQLTFVIAISDDSYTCGYELLESIKNTIYYSDIGVIIIDNGLSDSIKYLFQKNFNIIKFVNGQDLIKEVITNIQNIIQNFSNYTGQHIANSFGFINNEYQYFSKRYLGVLYPYFAHQVVKTNYYIYLDSDTYIQNEFTLDQLFQRVILNHFAAGSHSQHNCKVYAKDFPAITAFTKEDENTLCVNAKSMIDKPYAIFTVHGAHRDFNPMKQVLIFLKHFFENCKNEKLLRINDDIWTEEFLANYVFTHTVDHFSYLLLDEASHYFLENTALNDQNVKPGDIDKAFLNEDDYLLTHKKEMIGIIHYCGEKNRYYNIPVAKVNPDGSTCVVNTSLRYHEKPYENKEALLNSIATILMQLTRENHNTQKELYFNKMDPQLKEKMRSSLTDYFNGNEENSKIHRLIQSDRNKLEIDFDHTIYDHISTQKKPHDEDYYIFEHFKNKNAIVLDVGANYGYSVTSLVNVGCQSKIISFDVLDFYRPHLEYIKTHISKNNYDYYITGLSDQKKNIKFTCPIINKTPISALTSAAEITHERIDGLSHNLTNHINNYMPTLSENFTISIYEFTAEVETLDYYIFDKILKVSEEKTIDAIKLDVEGFEFEVLKGAINTLSTFKPLLLIESPKENLDLFLRENGYQQYFRYGNKLTKNISKAKNRVNKFYLHNDLLTKYKEYNLLSE